MASRLRCSRSWSGDYLHRLCDSIGQPARLGAESGIGKPLPLGSLWAPWDSNPQPADYISGCLQDKARVIIICRIF
jgi:hypothetical protein